MAVELEFRLYAQRNTALVNGLVNGCIGLTRSDWLLAGDNERNCGVVKLFHVLLLSGDMLKRLLSSVHKLLALLGDESSQRSW